MLNLELIKFRIKYVFFSQLSIICSYLSYSIHLDTSQWKSKRERMFPI